MRISKDLNVNRGTVYKCIDKALAGGIDFGLKDKPHGSEPSISPMEKAWVISLACTKPKEYGYPEEVWSYSLLVKHIRKHAVKKGYNRLKKAYKSTIWRILNERDIRPDKIKYYLDRRDEEFEEKMSIIILVYLHVYFQNKQLAADDSSSKKLKIVTISYDEKPGIQALKTLAPDLPPVPGKYESIARDHQYKRLGTLSIRSGLDLHSGHVFTQVHDLHRSREFISFLEELDAYYDEDQRIRLLLHNHSIHTSKETMAYLSTRPNRCCLIISPEHCSWLNIIETLFSKMARTFLKVIRVDSKEGFRERVLQWVDNLNEEPVVHRWMNFNIKSEADPASQTIHWNERIR